MPHQAPAKIGPSLLAADLARLSEESKMVIEAGADYLHLDVMDGHFVPNMSWGMPVIKSLRKHMSKETFFDVHMMVSNPETWVTPMREAGADQYTFHIEATEDPNKLIQQVRDCGMRVGVAVKPGTPIEAVFPLVDMVDLVLVMTVEPGFGGQSFMPTMMPKVETLRSRYPLLDIQVDGGVGPGNVQEIGLAGANWLVAGSAVFKPQPPPSTTIALLRRGVEQYGNGRENSELTPLPSEETSAIDSSVSTPPKKARADPMRPPLAEENGQNGVDLTPVPDKSCPKRNLNVATGGYGKPAGNDEKEVSAGLL